MAENNPFTSGQAPAISMAGWALAPDIASQQLMLQRRNAIAQLLTQQGSKDAPQTQVIGGWAVPQSPMEGLGRMAQLLMGTYMQSNNDEKNAELSRQYAQILKAQADGDPMAPATPTSAQPQQAAQPTDLANGAGNAPQSQSGFAPPSGNTQGVSPAPQVPQSIPTAPTQGQRFMSAFAKGQIYGDNAAKAYLADTAKTDLEKNDIYHGITPQLSAALSLAKQRADAFHDTRAGMTSQDMLTRQMTTAPDQNSGAYTVWNNGVPTVTHMAGSSQQIAAQAAAEKAGANSQTLASPDQLVRNPDGTMQPNTVGNVINTVNPSPPKVSNLPQPFLTAEASASQTAGLPQGFLPAIRQIESSNTLGAINKNTNGTVDNGIYQINSANKGLNGDDPAHAAKLASAAYQKSGGDPKLAAIYYHGGLGTNPNSSENQRYGDKFMSAYGAQPAASTTSASTTPPQSTQAPKPQGVGEPIGLRESIGSNVKLASDTYNNLAASNTNAPVILNALDNVAKYAPGAITGAFADKRALTNSVLAMVPEWGSAKTAQEKTDLLNKNINRLVVGGSNIPGATDAFRTILESANPNNHMGTPAILEAVQQLKSIINMQQSNQKVLQNAKLNNDTNGVLSTHQNFTTNADPRIWQLNNMQPSEQAKFIKGLSPQDAATLLQKRRAIQQMGGL